MPVHLAHTAELERGFIVVAPAKSTEGPEPKEIKIEGGLVIYRADDEAQAHDLFAVGAIMNFSQIAKEQTGVEPQIFIVASDKLLGDIGEDATN